MLVLSEQPSRVARTTPSGSGVVFLMKLIKWVVFMICDSCF